MLLDLNFVWVLEYHGVTKSYLPQEMHSENASIGLAFLNDRASETPTERSQVVQEHSTAKTDGMNGIYPRGPLYVSYCVCSCF